jgi:hypothetical protein
MAGRDRNLANYAGRHPVRYLKDGPFRFRGVDPKAEATTVGEMLAEFAGSYMPSNRPGGLVLTNKQIRVLNKAEDVLAAGPVDGYFALEDAEYAILNECVPQLVNGSNRATSAPAIEDLLNESLTELPTSDEPGVPDAKAGKLYAMDGKGRPIKVGAEVK